MKRKADVDNGAPVHKKQKRATSSNNSSQSLQPPPPIPQANKPADKTPSVKQQPSRRVRKLVPPRPWSFNPAADNATGPRSAKEGRNYICLTRKTALGAYMRRCKALFLDDGYTSIHLSAMGAAIPHLMQVACALPDILPNASNEIHMEVTTGTVEVQDEVFPEDIDEDVVYDTRCKSTLKVTLTVGKGEGRIVEEPEQDMI